MNDKKPSQIPLSVSRIIPIKLKSTIDRDPEIHIQQTDNIDDVDDVSEISQSIAHIVQIKRLNRPSSMYQPKIKNEDEEDQDEELKSPDNLQLTTIENPEKSITKPTTPKLDIRKKEDSESVDFVVQDKNLIGIKAVGIITECSGNDAISTSEEELSSNNRILDKGKDIIDAIDDIFIKPVEKKPSLQSVESASSQFDVSEIPLDTVEIKNADEVVDKNVDQLNVETSNKIETNKNDEIPVIHTTPNVVDEIDVKVDVPDDEIVDQIDVKVDVPDDEFVDEIENKNLNQLDVDDKSPEKIADSLRDSASAPILDAETEIEHQIFEKMEHSRRSYSPSPDEKKIIEDSEKIDIIVPPTTETMNSKIPKLGLTPVAESVEQIVSDMVDEILKEASATESQKKLNPIEDPESPEYRPIIHQRSFEIPIVFDDTPKNISLQQRFVPLPSEIQKNDDEIDVKVDVPDDEIDVKVEKEEDVIIQTTYDPIYDSKFDEIKVPISVIHENQPNQQIDDSTSEVKVDENVVKTVEETSKDVFIPTTCDLIPKGSLDEVKVDIPVIHDNDSNTVETPQIQPNQDDEMKIKEIIIPVEFEKFPKGTFDEVNVEIPIKREISTVADVINDKPLQESQYEPVDTMIEDSELILKEDHPELTKNESETVETMIPVTADVEEFKRNIPRNVEIPVILENDDVKVEVVDINQIEETLKVEKLDDSVVTSDLQQENSNQKSEENIEEEGFVVIPESSTIPVDEDKIKNEQQQKQKSIDEAISGITQAAESTVSAVEDKNGIEEVEIKKKTSESSDNGFVLIQEDKPLTSETNEATSVAKREDFEQKDDQIPSSSTVKDTVDDEDKDKATVERRDSFDVSNMKKSSIESSSERKTSEIKIPKIIETKPELDLDDIDVVVEDASPEDKDDSSFVPVVLRRKEVKQKEVFLTPEEPREGTPKPTVIVSPQSRSIPVLDTVPDDYLHEDKNKNEKRTSMTSVIRTDQDQDSEAPLIRVKRKEYFEINENQKTPEKKNVFPLNDQTISETEEIANKYRLREAKLMERLAHREPSTTFPSTAQKSVQESKFFKIKTTENQHRLSPKSVIINPSGSMIKDLREANHELTHSPKSPSPSRTEDSLSPRTLTRINKLNVIFENGKKIDGNEVIHHHPIFVKDTSKYWYKPTISREDAINILRDKSPGTFVVRDSNSFPGAFGLALKVSKPPEGVPTGDGSELVRHFLIEPSSKGVKLKGCNNEPVFGTLAALVYQHSITPMALPCRLILPEYDPASSPEHLNAAQALLEQGAACNVSYIFSVDTESLTGPEAIRKTVREAMEQFAKGNIRAVNVHFKVSSQGITLTDNTRSLFFRRHYPVQSVIFAGIDPEDRKWDNNNVIQLPSTYVRQARIYGFVARKVSSRPDNACHIFAELDPEQPASAVVNFITKVMMGQANKLKTLPQ